MNKPYLVRADKLVTVSHRKTICDGAMAIRDGRIEAVGTWDELKLAFPHVEVLHFPNRVVTPSLVDCHTHLFEFAPGTLYPVTEKTNVLGGISMMLHALSCGITAVGEQITGHPAFSIPYYQYKQMAKDLPMDICFSLSTISIGFAEVLHYTAVTGSKKVSKEQLTHPFILEILAKESEYPGENVFINATPANFTEPVVPNAGEIIYTQEELDEIVRLFHRNGKKIGAHVGGEQAISMAVKAGIDVLHHAHALTAELMDEIARKDIIVVATPLGGTHLPPNSPGEIATLVERGIPVAISTDAYIPRHKAAVWIDADEGAVLGPEWLMKAAHASMKLLQQRGMDEAEILALLTLTPAKVLAKDHRFGALAEGMDANFLVATGVPGLEITEKEEIQSVFYRGEKVIQRA